MSRPAAFNSVASAVIAIVGEGFTRARRSARKAMATESGWESPNLMAPPFCEGVWPAKSSLAAFRRYEQSSGRIMRGPSEIGT